MANGEYTFGFEEFGGDDDDMEAVYAIGDDGTLLEVGRRPRRGKARRRERRDQRHAPAPKLIPAPQAVRVTPEGPVRRSGFDAPNEREQSLGFNPVVIAAGPNTVGEVEVNVQRYFQAQRLILSAADPATGNDVSALVVLTQALVMSDNQLPSGAPQALQGFRFDAVGANLLWTPCEVGGIIKLGFRNNGATQVVVSGTIYGRTR